MKNMNNSDKNNKIKEIVLAKIKSGQAKMKPRWHFILKSVLLISGIIILSIALFYLASFILFVLRQTGVLFAPAFGLRGIGAFFISLPWILILISIIFVAVLEILVKQYSFAYRKTLLYSLGAIIIFVAAGGWIMFASGMHQNMLERAMNDKLPVAGPFYKELGFSQPKDIYVGEIEEIIENGFKLKSRQGEQFKIIAFPETRFPFGADFGEGDMVMVFGNRKNGDIQAIGIHRIGDKNRSFSPRQNWRFPIPPKMDGNK